MDLINGGNAYIYIGLAMMCLGVAVLGAICNQAFKSFTSWKGE